MVYSRGTSWYPEIMATEDNISERHVKIDAELGGLLSANASISHSPSDAQRWNEFGAPKPGTVVKVATESDVVATVCGLISSDLLGSWYKYYTENQS